MDTLPKRGISTKFISPALGAGGWDFHVQIRENVRFTQGRVLVRSKIVRRRKTKFADCVLNFEPNVRLAVLEANDKIQSVGGVTQQALEYESLDAPFAISSNGKGFLDRSGEEPEVEQILDLNSFPSPDQLCRGYAAWNGVRLVEAFGQEVVA